MAVLMLLPMAEALHAQSGSDLATGVPEPTFSIKGTTTAETINNADTGVAPSTTKLSLHRPLVLEKLCVETAACRFSSSSKTLPQAEAPVAESDKLPDGDSKNQPPVESLGNPKADDFNRDIYYKNKLEFSLEGGWLPIDIPWPFDVFNGDAYDVTGVNYTLVPIIASLRWHMDDVGGPWILRGNWDCTFSASVTAIPRGPETRYFAYMMGFRRNFVRPRWRTVPYFNILGGLGQIDAKGPLGVYGAQGQNFTFTLHLGSGIRYNFSPRYAISAGIDFMHISNFYLSEPKFLNYGINVYGPMIGIDVQLRPHGRHL